MTIASVAGASRPTSLLTHAAPDVAGSSGTVAADVGSGGSSFPVVPVAVGAAALAACGVGAYLLMRGRGGAQESAKLVQTIDGIGMWSNPQVAKNTRRVVEWGVPQGSVFGTTGPRVSIEHIDQRKLADCFHDAVLGANALKHPERIEARVVEHASGNVVVKLADEVRGVTRELPLVDGQPAYAASGAADPVFWPAYIEKAYATSFREGYEALDHGGYPPDVFKAVFDLHPQPIDTPMSVVDDVARRLDAGEAVVMSTRNPKPGTAIAEGLEQYDLHGWHAYVAETPVMVDGKQHIQLFNIWGKEHPKPLPEDAVRRLLHGVTSETEHYHW